MGRRIGGGCELRLQGRDRPWPGDSGLAPVEVTCAWGDVEDCWCHGEKVGDRCTRPNKVFPLLIADCLVMFVGYGTGLGLQGGREPPFWVRWMTDRRDRRKERAALAHFLGDYPQLEVKFS